VCGGYEYVEDGVDVGGRGGWLAVAVGGGEDGGVGEGC